MTKEELKATANEALTDAKTKIQELLDKSEGISSELKSEFDEQVAILKTKKEELELKLDELEDQSEDKWEEIKDILGDSVQSFKEGFTNLGRLFD
jgi:DNA repair exonuclease SbcCD ATPase subunit